MPIYEYRCSKCGDVFETIQKFSDPPLTAHPECGGRVERLISTSALQFKGSGWYVNDYAKATPGAKTEGKADSKSEGQSDGASEAKSEGSKSEGKSDSKSSETATKTEPKPAAPTKASE